MLQPPARRGRSHTQLRLRADALSSTDTSHRRSGAPSRLRTAPQQALVALWRFAFDDGSSTLRL
jgi:hypothetical protein